MKKFRLSLLSCILVTSLLFSGVAYAQDEELPSPGITPDSPFYFVDIWGKKIGLFFAFGPEAKARKALEYAEERLAEAQVMAAKNKARGVKRAASGYDEFVTIVTEKAEEARQQGVDISDISTIVALATSKHLSILDGVMDIVPAEVKGAIVQARGVSLNGMGNALQDLAIENPERATEINLAAIEGRLNRAKAKAEENNTEGVEDALDEFEVLSGFGQEISEMARGLGKDTSTVEELVALATSVHLSALDGIMDIVPEEVKEAIVRAKGVSINGMGNALQALATVNPERAIEINLAAIEGRLNRAKAEAEENNTDGVEDALDEFVELIGFGQEISEMARGLSDNTTVEQLVARATSFHLEILAEVYELVYEKVPEQAKAAIEMAMASSVRGYERATQALKAKGALGEIPEEVLIPEVVPEEVKERISTLKLTVPTNPIVSENEVEEEEMPGPERAQDRRP